MTVSVLGAATTMFGELWAMSPRTLARQAVNEALRQAETPRSEVEALFVGNMLSGILGGQEHLGAFYAEELGITASASKLEGACASGGLAVHSGVNSILSGQYKTVVVLGVEKMTDHSPEDVASALMGAGNEEERASGITFPGLYAMLARAHMDTYGTTRNELAAVAVKNHAHGVLNPKAQFHTKITVEHVLGSPLVADPLRLLDCSPISDGAAALVLSVKKKEGAPQILASVVATDTLGLAQRGSLAQLLATKRAALKAFQIAGCQPKDIDIAEVHDCFTIAEILALEDIGFYKKGEAARAIEKGEVTLGTSKKLIVNVSGGLKGCGHPVGATGVKQIVELSDQLRAAAGARQVKGAHIGLAHNVGGSGATAVVHILSN